MHEHVLELLQLVHLMREAIRGHQRPSEAIRGHQRPSEAIRRHQIQEQLAHLGRTLGHAVVCQALGRVVVGA